VGTRTAISVTVEIVLVPPAVSSLRKCALEIMRFGRIFDAVCKKYLVGDCVQSSFVAVFTNVESLVTPALAWSKYPQQTQMHLLAVVMFALPNYYVVDTPAKPSVTQGNHALPFPANTGFLYLVLANDAQWKWSVYVEERKIHQRRKHGNCFVMSNVRLKKELRSLQKPLDLLLIL